MNLWKKQANEIDKILNTNRGFSLVEILVSLTLIGIAGTFVVGNIIDRMTEGKIDAARIQMGNYANQLREFKRKCNFYPDSGQGLDSLISAPGGRTCKNYPPNGFIEEDSIPLDPWDAEYSYDSDGKRFTIKSFGADNEEGGEDYDADIYFPKKKK